MGPGFTERQFRDALGLFPTGVAIVAARVGETLLGATISSFNSVSLSPPLILFSLSRSALSASLWRSAEAFSITILGEGDRELSNRFAKAGADKWQGIDPLISDEGIPLLPAGVATFMCRTYAVHDGGDHDIFIGRAFSFSTSAGEPLLFYRGKYRHLKPPLETPLETPLGLDHVLRGW
ncbi:MAG: flavin reductase family protein [Beijerinckiaceae bacterium]|nr:flavin reductase family protein [Beijerinckiaceae bacterium]